MSDNYGYLDGEENRRVLEYYQDYQKKYAGAPRDSDKVIIGIVETLKNEMETGLKLLDIGCSSGNLLKHLKQAIFGLELTGGDLVADQIERNNENPALTGIRFERMDILNLEVREFFDVITVNAMVYALTGEQFQDAMINIASALNPGGHIILFDFFHPFPQEIKVTQKTMLYPDGHSYSMRSFASAKETLENSGFSGVEFFPFKISVDLPKDEKAEPVLSHTVGSGDERLIFHGSIFLPWCHVVAKLPSKIRSGNR